MHCEQLPSAKHGNLNFRYAPELYGFRASGEPPNVVLCPRSERPGGAAFERLEGEGRQGVHEPPVTCQGRAISMLF
jgi:hypothetical protein